MSVDLYTFFSKSNCGSRKSDVSRLVHIVLVKVIAAVGRVMSVDLYTLF